LEFPANLLASVGTVWIFLIMALVVADVIGRDFLDSPITGVAEFSSRSSAPLFSFNWQLPFAATE
jgi:TRAP-type C4-dicarboxylate transport system permease small subunit